MGFCIYSCIKKNTVFSYVVKLIFWELSGLQLVTWFLPWDQWNTSEFKWHTSMLLPSVAKQETTHKQTPLIQGPTCSKGNYEHLEHALLLIYAHFWNSVTHK
jgi:hypothetical protein